MATLNKNNYNVETCKSVIFFSYYVFQEENFLTGFFRENTNKMTLAKNCTQSLCSI